MCEAAVSRTLRAVQSGVKLYTQTQRSAIMGRDRHVEPNCLKRELCIILKVEKIAAFPSGGSALPVHCTQAFGCKAEALRVCFPDPWSDVDSALRSLPSTSWGLARTER